MSVSTTIRAKRRTYRAVEDANGAAKYTTSVAHVGPLFTVSHRTRHHCMRSSCAAGWERWARAPMGLGDETVENSVYTSRAALRVRRIETCTIEYMHTAIASETDEKWRETGGLGRRVRSSFAWNQPSVSVDERDMLCDDSQRKTGREGRRTDA